MADLQLLHLVARTAAGARPFQARFACADLWARLGRSFDLVACVLMPNHVHVLAQVNPRTALRAFARVLSAFRLRTQAVPGIRFEWEPLPRAEKVQRDKRHIARTIRYIHLNPVRDALCNDPLEWEWSTHRDWVGAVAHPCVDRARWARALGKPEAGCSAWLHEYVSSDPSVRSSAPLVEPTPFLGACPRDASVDALASAVPRVLRSGCTTVQEFGAVERRLFLLSAARWTRYRAPELARHVGRHPTNVRKTLRCAQAAAAATAHATAAATNATTNAATVAASSADAATAAPAPTPDVLDASAFDAHPSPASPFKRRSRPEPNGLAPAELLAIALTLADPRLSTALPPCHGARPGSRPPGPPC